ncbi:hypothetical protein CHS0354_001667 [Potamilus streckersoni]|uniref:Uncharacterized protein n=1 Tax=Potamilus streckersoni TaxID=2493646 RepID=A0AAE0VJK2_9BIVA|nr:hypothetical protein CHS0354_001667 [Potamilus streckersoni]
MTTAILQLHTKSVSRGRWGLMDHNYLLTDFKPSVRVTHYGYYRHLHNIGQKGVSYSHRVSATVTGCQLQSQGVSSSHRVSDTVTRCQLQSQGINYRVGLLIPR